MNDMVDMSQFVEAKSDQLNADDLLGTSRTITVTRVTGSDSNEQPVVIHYEGDQGKPFKPCKTMRRILLGVWGKHASEYVGRSMTLYRDNAVTFGGLEVGGIRISHMSHIDAEKTIVVNKTRGKKAGIKILPLKAAPAPAAKEDAAEKWASAYTREVGQAVDTGTLDGFVGSKAAKLEELKAKRPELYQRCIEAVDAKRNLLDGEETESFGDDFTDDTPTDEPTPDFSGFVTGIEARILNATTAEELDAIGDDIGANDALPEEETTRLDGLVAKARRALK